MSLTMLLRLILLMTLFQSCTGGTRRYTRSFWKWKSCWLRRARGVRVWKWAQEGRILTWILRWRCLRDDWRRRRSVRRGSGRQRCRKIWMCRTLLGSLIRRKWIMSWIFHPLCDWRSWSSRICIRQETWIHCCFEILYWDDLHWLSHRIFVLEQSSDF